MESPRFDACIIGAGISGLSTAAFLLEHKPELRILILEKATRPGGAISSYNQNGYLAEWGPHGFLDNSETGKKLIRIAGIEDQLETAPLGEFVRYVCLDGRLQLIPQKAMKIIREPLISPPAKLRVLGDLFKGPMQGDPTVAQWCEYRFGKALLPFADAVFTGTYAGDINRLKINSVMPGIRGLELEHGSVIRGAVKRMISKRRSRRKAKRGLPAMTSFVNGMATLPTALANSLQEQCDLRYDQEVTAIQQEQDSWVVETTSTQFRCEHVVTAVPVNTSLQLLKGTSNLPPAPLQKIPEARLAVILLGFDKDAEIPFGFGYLAPEKEERFSLGALFSSHMFPGRAPAGHQLVEVLVGGRRHGDKLKLDDKNLINEAYRDLRSLMHLPKAPCFSTVLRPQAGIPQLEAGYTDLLDWRNRIQQTYPNFHICGFGWNGIGINDMTKEAEKTAERILAGQLENDAAEVKGIYF